MVTLRRLNISDKTKMAELANNKKIWDNVRDRFGHPYTDKNAKEFIEMQSTNDMEGLCHRLQRQSLRPGRFDSSKRCLSEIGY